MSLYVLHEDVAVVTLDHPPVNSLSHALRTHLAAALQAAQADAAVRAVVLVGAGRDFSAGADVGELGTPAQRAEPVLPTLLRQVEDCTKPVVAAVGGVALGGGLELAMSCHGRVALSQARVGLPEISLGLIPGAGGTQRLPRWVGAALAIDMVLRGDSRAARALADSGLFDAVVDDALLAAALARARALADQGAPWPRAADRALAPAEVQAAVAQARTQLNSRQRLQPAYAAALDALEAAALPLDEGLTIERQRFLSLVDSGPARALRHQFKAERDAGKSGVDATARAVQRVAVIGAGTMGAGIAVCALEAGLEVLLLEQGQAALDAGRQRVQAHYDGRVEAGKMSPALASERLARLQTTLSWPALGEADVVIEAVFEDLAVKQAVFRQIDAHARVGAVLATNTSYLDIDAIAAVTRRPADVLGLHFFSPAQVMKLLEVVRGTHSAADVLATGVALGKRLGKLPVVCANAFGFIGNRIYNAYRKQCEFMLEDGAWPEEVDQALTGMGFAMGPFAVADLSGLDIAWRMRQAQAATRDARERYVPILDGLCEAGRLGRKSGAGYYVYTDGRAAKTTDAQVRALIEQARAARGAVVRALSAEQIRRRALLAMVNEAALLLAEGVAQRASDIDVVLVQGYGFPRWEGGPVFWARQQDRPALQADLEQLVHEAGWGCRLGDLGLLWA